MSEPGARRRRALAVLALLPALLLAACGGSAPDAPATLRAPGSVGADASRTRPAELQAGATHLLVERVYATAAARSTPTSEDALVALDDSSVALADLLGASYRDAREPLLGALRNVDARAVAQAAGQVGGQVGGGPVEPLRAAQAELAAVVRRVVPRLAADDVRERLDGDLTALLAVGGDDPYAMLRAAAGRAPDTAALLADGIAEDRDMGSVGTRAATLRARLTGLLTEHVLLAGAVAAAEPAPEDPAVRALEASGRELSDLLGTAYPDLPRAFAPSWAGHVDRVVALARLRTDAQRRAVLAFSTELGELMEQHVGGLSAATTTTETDPLLADLVAAVDAGASGAPDARRVLRRATAEVPVLSALLAAAIAEDRGYT